MLAKRIAGGEPSHLELMDITVARNAFGRQRESFECDLDVKGINEPVRAVFIRAPLINEVGPDVEVLTVYNDEIVTARQDNLLVSSFHPELTDDYRLHQYFADMVKVSVEAKQ
ncbi:Glutamine amidotransferase subunit PdxT [compost metagenome]